MMDSVKYRERWESKKTLYLKSGFSVEFCRIIPRVG